MQFFFKNVHALSGCQGDMRLFPVRKVSTVTVGSVPVSTMDRRRGGRGQLKKEEEEENIGMGWED